jgi:phage terminase small subunit
MPKPVSDQTRQRMRRAKLSLKQERFVKEYARSGNGTDAARKAGYQAGNKGGKSPHIHSVMASENLTKPAIAQAIQGELARIALKVSPDRVQRRLDEISHEAQADGQYGPAVRAEELLGKSIGMWVDQSVNISVSSEHVQALLNQARQRQLEPIDNSDDAQDVVKTTDDD